MAKKSLKKLVSYLIVILVIIGVPTLLLGTGVYFVRKAYLMQKADLRSAIERMAEFSEEDAAREAAEEIGQPYPVPAPTESPEEIKRKTKEFVLEKCNEKFSKRQLSEKIIETGRKYKPVSVGDTVRFQKAFNDELVEGKYRGKQGNLYIVGQNKYLLLDIAVEYRYLFDADIANRMADEKIAALKQSFDQYRRDFAEKLYSKKEEDFFKEAGYSWHPVSGKWISPREQHSILVEEKRRKFEEERLAEHERLHKEHRLFGIFPVKIDENENNTDPDVVH